MLHQYPSMNLGIRRTMLVKTSATDHALLWRIVKIADL